MDIYDMATEVEIAQREAAISNARALAHVPVTSVGSCLNCEEKISDPKRWCDAHCRDEWERMRSAANRR